MKRLALLTSLGCFCLLVLPPVSGATIKILESFRTEIDVKMDVTERSVWNGIAPGCYAPQESFDTALTARIDSTPSSDSKLRAGTVTLLPGSFGATSTYGAKRSFRQSAKSGQWDLEVQYPPGCGNTPAPAAPAWATSPTCKKTSERVSASLIQHDTDGDAGSEARITDGSLLITRVPKVLSTARGASIGESCLRTLHDVVSTGIDSEVSFMLRSTFIQVPVPNLKSKLSRLANGGAKSRPSFTIKIKVGGDCGAMTMSPSIGGVPGFEQSPGSTPRSALGNIFGDYSKSRCTVAGSGRAIVRRVGKVTATARPF